MKTRKKANLQEDDCKYCVLCHGKTPYKRNDPIQDREWYVVGVGQLCERCGCEIELEKRVTQQKRRLQKLTTD